VKLVRCLLAVPLSLAAACTSTPRAASRPEGSPVAVSTARAAITDVATRFDAGGIVRARATAAIASRVMAPIVEIHVRPGDRVRRGQPLMTLDAREIVASKTQAEAAALAADQSARAAEADLRAAEAAVLLARATHERIRTLHAKRSATEQELDQTIAALSGADAQRAGAQARVAAATAARDAAAASAHAAAITATYADLRAPFDGVVTERRADPGAMATPGTPLLTMEDPSTYQLEAPIDAARAALVAIGQPVDVEIDSTQADDSMHGRVVEIARVDPASHAFLVKIDLPPAARLRSGLFGRATFAAAARRALTVPNAAVITRGQLTFVYLVDTDRAVRLRPISIGAPDRERVEVLAGLRDGDAVVVHPPASLADGDQIAGAAR
jgi:multidrug efflux pump subunit AcrA (membrane-fusion protein)